MDKSKTKRVAIALLAFGGVLLIGGRLLWSGTYYIGPPPLEMVLVGYGGAGSLILGVVLFVVSLCIKEEGDDE